MLDTWISLSQAAGVGVPRRIRAVPWLKKSLSPIRVANARQVRLNARSATSGDEIPSDAAGSA